MKRIGSVCSGIGAPEVAWTELGWRGEWCSEIDRFASSVMAHRHPSIPNLGNMEALVHDVPPAVDVLVGGTPCQSFSVAGLRGGLADPRGNLALAFVQLAGLIRPRWVVWENVPGVLSADGGRAFGAIIGGLAELGYGWAYRVLDAQYFGVPQRRRRVFLVGCLGGPACAAAVLFERASLRGDPPPSREERAHPSAGAAGRARISGIAGTLGARGPGRHDLDGAGAYVPEVALALRAQAQLAGRPCLDTYVAHTLRGEGFDASEDGTGRGTPLVPIAFDQVQVTHPQNRSRCAPGDNAPTLARDNAARVAIAFSSKDYGGDAGELSPTLRAGGHHESHANGGVPPAIAFHQRQAPISGPVSPALGTTSDGMGVHHGAAVRRLTPRECERLQGFPDDYTAIPGAKDGPRYRALGNSMAVPVVRRLGERIDAVDAATLDQEAA